MILFHIFSCLVFLSLLSESLEEFSPIKFKDFSRSTRSSPPPFEDQLFRLEQTGPSDLGNNVNFSCQLPASKALQKGACHFEMPNGKALLTRPNPSQESDVFDEDGTAVQNLKAKASGKTQNSCGISILNMTEECYGRWICIFNKGSVKELIGTITLLTKNESYVKDVRLPRHVVPEHYDVDLFPFIEVDNFTVSGSVKLKFKVTRDENLDGKDTNLYKKIYLHSTFTKIEEDAVDVKTADGTKTFKAIAHEFDSQRDFYIIHLSEEMPKDTDLIVNIRFVSYLNKNLDGFYRSKYQDSNKTTKYLAVTQFETLGARLAFPCLDEPDRKSTFTVSLTSKSGMTALSNLNVSKTEILQSFPGYIKTTFHQSVKMSTYLLAFMVSDFDYVTSEDNPNFKVWYEPSKSGQGNLAVEAGAKILKFYEGLFNIPYPLPKMDMAAIPDFSAGAMENWGLVLYKEWALLLDTEVAGADEKETIISVIAHELAHQWFGNIVTLGWWSDTWLNEGFATYYEYQGMDHVFGEARAKDQLIWRSVQEALNADSNIKSPALSEEVTNPLYSQTFGVISYQKGCAIIRMMENFLSSETFLKGIKNYLNKNLYGNVGIDQLWMALDQAAQEDKRLPSKTSVKDIMDDWTLKAGYPVVNIQPTKGSYIQLTQKRYFQDPSITNTSDVHWSIPINFAYPKYKTTDFRRTAPSHWMSKSGEPLEVQIKQWPYVVNVQATGFYRINYDERNWKELADLFKENHNKIHVLNRVQLLDDSFKLARAEQLGIEHFLNLTEYLSKESNYLPWASAQGGLGFVNFIVKGKNKEAESDNFKLYVLQLLNPLYKTLKFDGAKDDKHLTIKKRKLVLEWLFRFKDQDCINRSVKMFKSWMEDPTINQIDPDIRRLVYWTAVRYGGEAEWNFLWNRFQSETRHPERPVIMSALGATTDESLIRKYLNITLDFEMNFEEVIRIYSSVASTVEGVQIQFDWFKENLDLIRNISNWKFKEISSTILRGPINSADTMETLDKLDQFVKEKLPEFDTPLTDMAKSNLNFKEKYFPMVRKWLEDKFGPLTAAPTTTTTTTTTSAAEISSPTSTILSSTTTAAALSTTTPSKISTEIPPPSTAKATTLKPTKPSKKTTQTPTTPSKSTISNEDTSTTHWLPNTSAITSDGASINKIPIILCICLSIFVCIFSSI